MCRFRGFIPAFVTRLARLKGRAGEGGGGGGGNRYAKELLPIAPIFPSTALNRHSTISRTKPNPERYDTRSASLLQTILQRIAQGSIEGRSKGKASRIYLGRDTPPIAPDAAPSPFEAPCGRSSRLVIPDSTSDGSSGVQSSLLLTDAPPPPVRVSTCTVKEVSERDSHPDSIGARR